MSNKTQGLTGQTAANHEAHGGGHKQQLLKAIQTQRIEDANKFKAARSYYRRVQKLKIGLPIIGCLFIAVFIGIAYLAQFTSLPLGFATIDLTNGQVVMERPTLNGFTSSNAEYEIVAERAFQDLTDPKKVLLEKIGATLTLEDGNIVSIDAGEGKFNVEGQHLLLSEGISLHMSACFSGELERATIDIKGGTLISKGDVLVKADIGEIRAKSLTVRENATFILFEDRVRMVVNPSKVRQK